MALGTITQVAVDPHSSTQVIPVAVGDLKMTITTVVGDGSYPTGGTSLTPAQLGLSNVVFANVGISASAGSVTSFSEASYNTGTQKLQVFANTGAEVTATTSLSNLTFSIQAFGY